MTDTPTPPQADEPSTPPLERWELGIVSIAVALALILGFCNLGKPSVWHDESVHIYVAKSILEKGWPQLPSGAPYVSGALYSLILAGFMAVFGGTETAVRTPSVFIAATTVVVTYFLLRRLLGRPTAALAVLFLALSPWSVAWSRQARFYALQELLYMLFLWGVWWTLSTPAPKQRLRRMVLPLAVYGMGLATALHSVLFLGPIAAYTFFQGALTRTKRRSWLLLFAAVTTLGIATVLIYRLTLPKADIEAIFQGGGLGGKLADPSFDIDRSPRLYYFIWLKNNLSVGFLALAMAGFVAMLAKERWRGLYAALAFWLPLFALTYLIGYRRERFMYFAYPMYVAAYSYGAAYLARIALNARRSWLHAGAAICIALFGCRLAISTAHLIRNSVDTARGADVSLAVLHPQWRKPCQYILEHRDGAAVLSTSYMPALYYLGQVDDWYPSGVLLWEKWESGLTGLKNVDDLKAFIAKHPRGYFLAEIQRFGRWNFFAEDKAFVDANMKRLDNASGRDVILYSWGM